MLEALGLNPALKSSLFKPSSATPPSSATTGVGEDAWKKEPSYTVGGNID
jgi:hypothetical protein